MHAHRAAAWHRHGLAVSLTHGARRLRAQGYTNRDAIVLGLQQHGGVITTAGLIMALAFSGLLFSSTLAVRQV